MTRTKKAARKVKSARRDVQAVGAPMLKQRKPKKAKNNNKGGRREDADMDVHVRSVALRSGKSKIRRKRRRRRDDTGSSATDSDTASVSEMDGGPSTADSSSGDLDDEGFIELAAEEEGGADRRHAPTAAPTSMEVEVGEEREATARHMDEKMPWMGDRAGYRCANLYVALHEEIMDFVRFVSPTQAELEARQQLIASMTTLVHGIWTDATLDTFGSHRTHMFLPSSDIDFVLFDVPEGKAPLFALAEKLEEDELVSYLEVIDKARIPIVKFVHKATGIHVDVSFNVTGGLATADLVRHYMRVYPSFRPLTLVLKYFLAQRDLNETFSGGIGSFLLQLMVVSFLQHHRRQLGTQHDDPRFNNLGQLLVGFFTLYGRDFNYEDLGISVRNGGEYFSKYHRDWYDDNRPFLLSMENPNEPELDVAKNSYEIHTIKRSFEYARQVLQNEIHRRGQFHALDGSILGTIIANDAMLSTRMGPETFGFEILYHDPTKTAEVRRQYEQRCDDDRRKKQAESSSSRPSKQQHRDQRQARLPPHLRLDGRRSRLY